MNLAADLQERSRRHGWDDRVAFHTPDGDHTHAAVHDLAARAATVRARRGVGEGDRVVLALTDRIAWVVAFLATARLGATAVPVNPTLTADDHRFLVGDCAAVLVVGETGLEDRMPSFLDGDGLLAEAATAPPAAAVATGAPLYVYYTSGTTGRPKGVVYPQGSLDVYAESVGGGVLDVRPDDVGLSVSKMYFGYGFNNTFVFPLHTGSAAVLVPERPTPAAAAALVERFGVTLLYSVTSWYAQLVTDAEPAAFATVRAAVSGGESLPAALAVRVGEFLGAPLLNQLGATEVGCAATANTVHADRPGSVGWPVGRTRTEVRDPAGRVLDDGETGELWVTPVRMTGYLNLPEATAAALQDGWFRTRDLVRREPDGSFVHLGRADDMEMVGGITVAPAEIEAVLSGHAAVREAGVVALPDDRGRTRLRAVVVRRDVPSDTSDPDADRLADELVVWCRERLAPFKVPRSIDAVPSLPRTPSGKLRRFLLREQVSGIVKGRAT